MNWRKSLKYAGIAVAVVMVSAIGFAAYLMHLFGSYEDVELGRFPNPSASLEAVMVERLANATVPQITFVSVVQKGEHVSEDNAFFGNFVEGMTVRWLDDRTLIIHADSARIVRQKDQVDMAGAVTGSVKIKYEILDIQRRAGDEPPSQ